MPITYEWQHDQRGLAHALLQAEYRVGDDFLLVNGDNVLRADLNRVISRQREDGIDAVALVEEVSPVEARTTGVVETDGERVVGMVEKSDDPPSTVVGAGCYGVSPAVVDACRLVELGAAGVYQLGGAMDRLNETGGATGTVRRNGWQGNVTTPADVKRAPRLLREDRS